MDDLNLMDTGAQCIRMGKPSEKYAGVLSKMDVNWHEEKIIYLHASFLLTKSQIVRMIEKDIL